MQLVATGVKHLHKAAHDYDVGVYFEANGHGTVLFSNNLKRRLAGMTDASSRLLLALIDVINETVGDALSDLLAIEAILALSGMDVSQWASLYADLPSWQTKVVVADRTRVQTVWDESRCTAPVGLQQAIEDAVAATGDCRARAFVRPSGTEDIVRVYAEATADDTMRTLTAACVRAVKQFCDTE